jgi:DNA-binding GntR family transcriptional regulator
LRGEADAAMAAARRGDVVRYLHHNVRFHQIVVDAADNGVLRHTWESLGFTVGARVRASRTSGDMIAVAAEHLEIVAAIARGDTKAAGRLLRHHAEVLVERTTRAAKKKAPPADNQRRTDASAQAIAAAGFSHR